MKPSPLRRFARHLLVLAAAAVLLAGAGCSINQEFIYEVLNALVDSYVESQST